MTQLEAEMTVLRRLFEPWNTAPHGTVIWEPEPSDPNAAYKHDLIAKASEVIAAGDAALAGAPVEVPDFGEQNYSEIQEALSADHEERDFIELAAACERVRRSLMQHTG